MSEYQSRMYRNFLLQQTNRGWHIVNAPSRDRAGPISPGPYSTYAIAEHVVDRIMDNSYGPSDNPRNGSGTSHLFPSVKDDPGFTFSDLEFWCNVIVFLVFIVFTVSALFFPSIAESMMSVFRLLDANK